ncbi:triokinase/FMN cyclase-like [Patiria miniata]|uniref:Triokinase/FMN cyclase n=1 Tax=Patiria miniata TaxID=46514 RepID=A0A913ZYN0_PATMI|nr:triokinase/FMN cyclase-like [Patiria miniata]
MAGQHKQFLNTVGTCVDEMLEGVVAVNPAVKLLKGHRVVLRADIAEYKTAGKVAVLCGGGSGHEPFASGYVGRGMLTGAVAGSVFTSPPASDILAAIRAVANPAGVLLIVANYTGDRINFGLAAEKAKAQGVKIETVTVAEDSALTSVDKTAGKRGLCGIILVQKIAGAMAEEGHTLTEIVEATTRAAKSMGTIGISLSPCHVPGSGATFQIGDEEMELGLGVHGEPGVKRMKVCPADAITAAMIDHMTNTATSSHIEVKSGDRVLVLLNNLGATSALELFLMARSAIRYIESKGVIVERAMAGHFMTSLDMAGLSLTIMHLDEERKRYIDKETNALGWQRGNVSADGSALSRPRGSSVIEVQEEGLATDKQSREQSSSNAGSEASTGATPEISKRLVSVISAICETLIAAEDRLNDLDRSGGDGDCGTTMKRGAEAILRARARLVAMGAGEMMDALADTVERSMGGSSGGLYSLFLTAAATCLGSSPSADQWVIALGAGMDAVCRYGGAEPGDRTMLDPLHAARVLLEKAKSGTQSLGKTHFQQAVEAAEDTAVRTATMEARAGRASYVNKELVREPDPGAQAVAAWLRAAFRCFYGE